MIIDFHTHIFPDKIAKKTIEILSQKGGIPPYSDGSASALADIMDDAGVDISVTLPVLTNPNSFESVNRYAAEVNEKFKDSPSRLISFGAIHPACDDIDGKMKWLKEQGFQGVKLHPDYQDTFINDPGYVRIMECAKEYDLIAVTHAGVDIAYPDNVHCTATLAKELIKKVPHSKFVLAHCGGVDMMDEFMDLLCDEDVYFDTAYILRFVDKKKFKEIIKRRGADRILFATDSPWSEVKRDVEILKSFALEKTVEEKLFSLNAKRLLRI